MHLPTHNGPRRGAKNGLGTCTAVLLVLLGGLCVVSLVVLRNSQAENTDLRAQLQDQEETNERLKSKIEKVKEDVANLSDQAKKLIASSKSTEEELARVKEARDKLANEKDALEKGLAAARAKAAEGETALKAAQQETSALKLQVSQLEGDGKELHSAVEELSKKVEACQSSLKAMEQAAASVTNALAGGKGGAGNLKDIPDAVGAAKQGAAGVADAATTTLKAAGGAGARAAGGGAGTGAAGGAGTGATGTGGGGADAGAGLDGQKLVDGGVAAAGVKNAGERDVFFGWTTAEAEEAAVPVEAEQEGGSGRARGGEALGQAALHTGVLDGAWPERVSTSGGTAKQEFGGLLPLGGAANLKKASVDALSLRAGVASTDTLAAAGATASGALGTLAKQAAGTSLAGQRGGGLQSESLAWKLWGRVDGAASGGSAAAGKAASRAKDPQKLQRKGALGALTSSKTSSKTASKAGFDSLSSRFGGATGGAAAGAKTASGAMSGLAALAASGSGALDNDHSLSWAKGALASASNSKASLPWDLPKVKADTSSSGLRGKQTTSAGVALSQLSLGTALDSAAAAAFIGAGAGADTAATATKSGPWRAESHSVLDPGFRGGGAGAADPFTTKMSKLDDPIAKLSTATAQGAGGSGSGALGVASGGAASGSGLGAKLFGSRVDTQAGGGRARSSTGSAGRAAGASKIAAAVTSGAVFEGVAAGRAAGDPLARARAASAVGTVPSKGEHGLARGGKDPVNSLAATAAAKPFKFGAALEGSLGLAANSGSRGAAASLVGKAAAGSASGLGSAAALGSKEKVAGDLSSAWDGSTIFKAARAAL